MSQTLYFGSGNSGEGAGVGEESLDWLCFLESDIRRDSNSQQVLHAFGDAGMHRIHVGVGPTVLGHGSDVVRLDTGVHQVVYITHELRGVLH